MNTLKITSLNANGIRSAASKGLENWLARTAPDVLGLQEIKAEEAQVGGGHLFDGYHCFWNAARSKKGYSGTACYTRLEPLAVQRGLPDPRFQGEGRVIRLEFEKFHYFNI